MNYFNETIDIKTSDMGTFSTGIILKSFIPHKKSFCILDSKIGKIVCYWKTHKPLNFRPGFLISYTLQMRGSYYIISHVEALKFPYNLIKNNFELFHFIVELCDYFLPLHNAAEDLFSFLEILYEDKNSFENRIATKSFLFQFLTLLNLYPKDLLLESAIRNVIFSPQLRANIEEESLHLLLDNWLLGCMKDNEFGQRIKSFKFLKELGIYG